MLDRLSYTPGSSTVDTYDLDSTQLSVITLRTVKYIPSNC